MRVYYSCKSGFGLIVPRLVKFSWDATFPKTMSPRTQVLKILVRTLLYIVHVAAKLQPSEKDYFDRPPVNIIFSGDLQFYS